MKIIEICPYDLTRPGGVQNHVLDLAAWLERAGHQVRIVAPLPVAGAGLGHVDHIGGGRGFSLFGTGFELTYARRGARRRLVAELRDWGAELVHLHTPWTPLMAWQVWRGLRLPTVTTFHATLPADKTTGAGGRALAGAARYFLKRSRAAIVPSVSPLAHLRPEATGTPAHVLPPTIDLSSWRQAGDAVGTAPDEREGLEIVFLGRFEERKGLDVLLTAWPTIAEAVKGARLTVAGGGKLEPLVHRAMAGPGGDRIRLVSVPDAASARDLVARADLLAAPSPYGESFGLVLIEAMAAGTLPLAAANEGYTTVMTGPGARLLVPPGDAPALAALAIDLARKPEERACLRAWAEGHAARFDVARAGPAFVEVFQAALGR